MSEVDDDWTLCFEDVPAPKQQESNEHVTHVLEQIIGQVQETGLVMVEDIVPPPPDRIIPPRHLSSKELSQHVSQLLKEWTLLPNEPDTRKKKIQIIVDILDLQSTVVFNRVGRLTVLRELMSFFKDTMLTREHKKSIIISIVDLFVDVESDKDWRDECKRWLQADAMAFMDFLYEYEPSRYEPREVLRRWWKARQT